jgi:hypothetical protein
VRTPENAWALFGLMQAQQAVGDAAGAAASRKRFDEVWAGAPQGPQLAGL